MKKIISLLIVLVMCLGLISSNVIASANDGGITVDLEIVYDSDPDFPRVDCHGIIRAYKGDNIIWKYVTEQAELSDWWTITDVYVNSGNVYIVVNQKLYAFDIQTGNVKWIAYEMGSSNTVLFDKYGNVYVNTPGGTSDLVILNKNGRELLRKDYDTSWFTDIELDYGYMNPKLVFSYNSQTLQRDLKDYIDISQFKPVTVEFEEKEIDFDQLPVIVNGRTLVPIRAVIEAMGGNVQWDETTKSTVLTFGGNTIKLTVGSNIAYLNGEERTLDVPPQIINNRTLMPIRFIAEGFNFNVVWDGNTKTITINKQAINSVSINEELLNCIGKTKADIVSKYGGIVNSTYWEGGKYYIHQNSKTEFYYIHSGEYNYNKHDDLIENAKCEWIWAELSELFRTPDKKNYTIEELKNIFGEYKFLDDLDAEFHAACYYEFMYKNYKIRVESDHLNPVVEWVYVFKTEPSRDAYVEFLDVFQQNPLKVQSMPYDTILNDVEYLTSMQQILSYGYHDVDMDGVDELIISSKMLTAGYDAGGSCFSLWDYSSEKGVYNIFAKYGMPARSAYTYRFVENDDQIFLHEGTSMSNSKGTCSYRTLYQIKDSKIVPTVEVVYDTFESIYTVNGEPVSEQQVLNKFGEISKYNEVINQIMSSIN